MVVTKLLEFGLLSFNKLARDRIPGVIEGFGENLLFILLKKEEHLALLETKLEGELSEFKEVKNLEELSDLIEVIFAMAGTLGHREKNLLKKREKKRNQRGGFE